MRSVVVLLFWPLTVLAQPAEIPFAEAQRNVVAQAMPAYPALAKEAKASGTVQFKLAIDPQGRVGNVELLSGHPLLIPGALDVVENWRYHPFVLLDGTPREVSTLVGIKFDAARISVAPVEVARGQQAAINGTETSMSGTAAPYSVTAKALDDHVRNHKWPVYPATAKVQKITGTVRMRLIVDGTGNVTDVSAVEGPAALAGVAAASARQWTYRPFFRNGSAVTVTGDAYLTFTLNPDAQVPVFPGDEIDALLDVAEMTVRDLKIETTQKYCFEAIQRARSSNEDRSDTIQDALRILYELYSRAANADASKSEEMHRRLTTIMAEQEKPNGYWTAQAVFGLGGEYLSKRSYPEAGEQYAHAIALLEPCVDPPGTRFCSMLLGDVLGYQAIVLYAQGKHAQSLPFFERAISRPDGAIHEETKVSAMSIYANALTQLGRGAEAADAAKRSRDYQKTHPEATKRAGIAR